ncbi:MAG: hypothetical protein JWM57_2495, partial [Phycisphaerales bacterium]|nr:hypothetical protein [Phycisphaerales bacterium]
MPHARRRHYGLIASLVVIALATHIATAQAEITRVDFQQYDTKSAVRVVEEKGHLIVTWPIDATHNGVLKLSLDTAKPLIAALATRTGEEPPRPILQNVDPCGVLTVGTRNLKPAG